MDNQPTEDPSVVAPVEPTEEVVTPVEAPAPEAVADPETAPAADVEADAGENVVEEIPHVVEHLDVDPNDPRNFAPTPQLPTLNDPNQS